MAITFSNMDFDLQFKDRRKVGLQIRSMIFSENKRVGDISVLFCSDEKILETNREFLQHDYYTDIITFDYCEGRVVSGDLLISIDTVKLNAETYGVPFINELHRVIIHGVLHLLGLKDKTDDESAAMRAAEDKNLAELAIILKG